MQNRQNKTIKLYLPSNDPYLESPWPDDREEKSTSEVHNFLCIVWCRVMKSKRNNRGILEVFEMWQYQRILRLSWIPKSTNLSISSNSGLKTVKPQRCQYLSHRKLQSKVHREPECNEYSGWRTLEPGSKMYCRIIGSRHPN